jgi:hypothetical protein
MELTSLTSRIQLSKLLANSVLFLHTTKFVHKNIRPETIILLEAENLETSLGMPFLVGFEKFRAADGMTYLHGDTN